MDLTIFHTQAYCSGSVRAPIFVPVRSLLSDTIEPFRSLPKKNQKVSKFFGGDTQLYAAQIRVRRRSFHAQDKSSAAETSIDEKTDRSSEDAQTSLASSSGQSTPLRPQYRAPPTLPGKSPVKASPEKASSVISNMKYFATVSPPDGGPPRWFCPSDARPRTGERGSAKDPLPKLLFIPGATPNLPFIHHRTTTSAICLSSHTLPICSASAFTSFIHRSTCPATYRNHRTAASCYLWIQTRSRAHSLPTDGSAKHNFTNVEDCQ